MRAVPLPGDGYSLVAVSFQGFPGTCMRLWDSVAAWHWGEYNLVAAGVAKHVTAWREGLAFLHAGVTVPCLYSC